MGSGERDEGGERRVRGEGRMGDGDPYFDPGVPCSMKHDTSYEDDLYLKS